MNTETIFVYVSGFVTVVGLLLLAAAFTHGIVLGFVGTKLLYDAHLVGLIGFLFGSFGGLGVGIGLDMRGDIRL